VAVAVVVKPQWSLRPAYDVLQPYRSRVSGSSVSGAERRRQVLRRCCHIGAVLGARPLSACHRASSLSTVSEQAYAPCTASYITLTLILTLSPTHNSSATQSGAGAGGPPGRSRRVPGAAQARQRTARHAANDGRQAGTGQHRQVLQARPGFLQLFFLIYLDLLLMKEFNFIRLWQYLKFLLVHVAGSYSFRIYSELLLSSGLSQTPFCSQPTHLCASCSSRMQDVVR